MHRRGPGVVRLAFKNHVQAALAGDGVHNAERQAQTFEHRSLLDVKLKISEGVVTGARLADSRSDLIRTRVIAEAATAR